MILLNNATRTSNIANSLFSLLKQYVNVNSQQLWLINMQLQQIKAEDSLHLYFIIVRLFAFYLISVYSIFFYPFAF